jgi:hypothetical protein
MRMGTDILPAFSSPIRRKTIATNATCCASKAYAIQKQEDIGDFLSISAFEGFHVQFISSYITYVVKKGMDLLLA